MGFKTIFIIVISVLVTIILMNNTEEINFWIFGDARIPKLTILGVMFGLGIIVGFMVGRPRRTRIDEDNHPDTDKIYQEKKTENNPYLSDEDRDYIE